ncbi:hypothetical protein BDV93DRAFT_358880 [Ceratobasidium sp. AG-I]|nr:hypothetical protein BDV93DRAFT_358880 [Ceratobasidium sp. AG-I]
MSEYLSLCAALDRACDTPRTLLARQDVAAIINRGIESLDESADRPLTSAYNILDRILKRATSPALLLPPEILTEIFRLAAHREVTTIPYIHGINTAIATVENISRVCSYWREIALETKHIWSAVYLTGNSITQIQRWLERSGDTPLNLIGDLYGYASWPIAPVIGPHASHFSTLNLVFSNLENIHSVLNCWLDCGTPGSVTELSVQFTHGFSTNRDPPDFVQLFGLTPLSDERRDEFLRPLRVLRLKDIWLDWDSTAFEGLVELRLELERMRVDSYLSARQLSRILSASPELHTLELVGISVDLGEPNEAVAPASIVLPNLRTLYLQGMNSSSMDALLCAIAPGSYDIELDLTSGDENDVPTDQFRWRPPSHLGKNVTMLCLGEIFPEKLHAFLSSFPNLHTLYLYRHIWLTETVLRTMTRPLDADTTLPNLHALHIFGCLIFDSKLLQDMVASHSIKKLTLGGETLSRVRRGGPHGVRLRQHDNICEELATSVPEFKFYWDSGSGSGSDVDTTLDIMPRRQWRM